MRDQGNISLSDGHTKGKNGKHLTKAKEIKKKWQKYTEELYKKGLNDLDNHDDVIIESEVKWKHYYEQS